MEPHILSVQSHVARDYVGNRAGSLALQLLGREVDVINTVNFSSMYVHEGSILDGPEFDVIIGGLLKAIAQPKGAGRVGADASASELTKHDIPVVISGYIAKPEVLDSLANVVKKLKGIPCGCKVSENLRRLKGNDTTENCLYLMDPVMGDNGHLYVTDAMTESFRQAASVADVITPNEYELEWLVRCERSPTSNPVPSLSDILSKVRSCHRMGPFMVFLTSVRVAEIGANRLLSLTSIKRNGPSSPVTITIAVIFDRLDGYLGGCGDITSAVLTDRLMGLDVSEKTEEFAEQMKGVIEDTINTLQVLLVKNEVGSPSIQVVKNMALLRSAPRSPGIQSMVTMKEDCLQELIEFVRA